MNKIAVVQLNGNADRDFWRPIAERHNIHTIKLEDWDGHVQPQMILLQGTAHKYDLQAMGWQKYTCPIIGSCGDALTVTNIDTAFNNLHILTVLHVEGMDYFNAYNIWRQKHQKPDFSYKLRFQKLCADKYFEPISGDKKYDWCFAGQMYNQHDGRYKSYRIGLRHELFSRNKNCIIAGLGGWPQLLGVNVTHIEQPELNQEYAKCHVVISIDAHDGLGYSSTRTFEAMHGRHLTAIYDHPGMIYLKEFIHHGVHAYFFKTVEELVNIITHVKMNPTEAEAIRHAGRELVLKMGWTASAWFENSIIEFMAT